MAYQIVRNGSGWIINDKGEVLLKDVENDVELWVDNNVIYFNEYHRPCIKICDQDENDVTEQPLTFSHIDVENSQNSGDVQVGGDQGDDIPAEGDEDINTESGGEENINPVRSTWTHESTLALITAVECRYEDLFHIHKKKNFWNIVHEELLSNGFNYSPKTWENLLRTYKSSKDLKFKTGRGPTRFRYYDRMDEILGDTPTNSSLHSIDVHNILQEPNQYSGDLTRDDTPSPSTSSSQGKRKNPTVEYIKLKKKYYEEKQHKTLEKDALKQKYEILLIVNLKKERNDLTKKKLELEERKVAALEKLVSSCDHEC